MRPGGSYRSWLRNEWRRLNSLREPGVPKVAWRIVAGTGRLRRNAARQAGKPE